MDPQHCPRARGEGIANSHRQTAITGASTSDVINHVIVWYRTKKRKIIIEKSRVADSDPDPLVRGIDPDPDPALDPDPDPSIIMQK
jgi:hypothetical protein